MFTKITNAELKERGATTLPNRPKISATALKQEFDAPAKEIVAPAFNRLIDELEAETAAASLGMVAPTGRTGTTVQDVFNDLSSDLADVESEIEEAIQDAHTHENKEVLDKFDETEGALTYDGEEIGDMFSGDYDSNGDVKAAGGITGYVEDYVESQLPTVLKSTTYVDVEATRTFTFTNAAIQTTSRVDYYADVFGVVPTAVSLSSGSLSVSFDVFDGVTECAVEIK